MTRFERIHRLFARTRKPEWTPSVSEMPTEKAAVSLVSFVLHTWIGASFVHDQEGGRKLKRVGKKRRIMTPYVVKHGDLGEFFARFRILPSDVWTEEWYDTNERMKPRRDGCGRSIETKLDRLRELSGLFGTAPTQSTSRAPVETDDVLMEDRTEREAFSVSPPPPRDFSASRSLPMLPVDFIKRMVVNDIGLMSPCVAVC